MRTPIDRGLTAPPAYTPFGGSARLDRLIKSLDSADRRSVAWAGVLWTASIGAISCSLARWLPVAARLGASFVLGAVAAAAERQTVAIIDGTEMSVAFLPLVFAAIVFGPLGGFVVGTLSTALDLRESPLRWSVYTPIRGLTLRQPQALAAWTLFRALQLCVVSPGELGRLDRVSPSGGRTRGDYRPGCARLDRFAHAPGRSHLSPWLTVPFYVPVLRYLSTAITRYSLGSSLSSSFRRSPHSGSSTSTGRKRTDHSVSPRQMIGCAGQASRSPRPLLRLLTHETSTRPATRPPSRSTQETSRIRMGLSG